MTCSCGEKMVAELVITGGCQCGPEEYCYCDDEDTHIEFTCPVGRSKTHKPVVVKPGTLGDRYAIGRWFTENYTVDTN